MKLTVLALLGCTTTLASAQAVSCSASLQISQPRVQGSRAGAHYCADITNTSSTSIRVMSGLRGVQRPASDMQSTVPPGQSVTVCLSPTKVNGQAEYMLNFKTIALAVDKLPAADDKKFFSYAHNCSKR